MDLLAGIMVHLGRNSDLAFYGALQPLQRAGYYFTKSGQPIVGDLYEDLGAITAQVSVSRLLAAEDARLPCRQTKATRTMRLTCDGLVNMRL